jgi:hypothetical protein
MINVADIKVYTPTLERVARPRQHDLLNRLSISQSGSWISAALDMSGIPWPWRNF